ncbi:ABC transporter permease [Sediminitomix flava]|uniref:FtsX-like permease family protein n=1 Tax=Sediminitomix flava TaxID=379075 RepID=A0A315Z8Z1_SEDFL|nr:ABC transporter permease [Sediminitomix flava]PWJ40170.1 FtsX-like permease family protein [Sediminitomix flava]
MIKNYLIIAYRNLLKNRLYYLISILGLSVGISFFALLLLLVKRELSFDQFHSKSDRIYRVIEEINSDNFGERSSSLPIGFAPYLKENYSSYVEDVVRLYNMQVPHHTVSLEKEDALKSYNEEHLYFADEKFFDIFDFPIAYKLIQEPLRGKNNVVLSYQKAKELFGDPQLALGEKIYFQQIYPLKVVAVLEKETWKSHLKFDYLISFSSLRDLQPEVYKMKEWVWNPCWTYILLKKEVEPYDLEFFFPNIIEKKFPSFLHSNLELSLQPLTEVHLGEKYDYDLAQKGDIQSILIFLGIACTLLFISAINFINMQVAIASQRVQEFGIRKSVGAYRSEVIEQFLVEVLLVTLISVLFGMMILEVFTEMCIFFEFEFISISQYDFESLMTYMVIAAFTVGVISSIYPTYVLSNNKPAVLIGSHISWGSNLFSEILVITQFCISFFLLVSAIVVKSQLDFLEDKEVGFDREKILVIPMSDLRYTYMNNKWKKKSLYKNLKEGWEESKRVEFVTAVDEVVGLGVQTSNFMLEGSKDMAFLPFVRVNDDFIEAYGFNIIAGRSFRKRAEERFYALIVNRKMTELLGYATPDEAIGHTLKINQHGIEEKIVGVVEDFHFESLHNAIKPIVFDLNFELNQLSYWTKYFVLRVNNRDQEKVYSEVKKVWNENIGEKQFSAFWLTEKMKQHYNIEEFLMLVSSIFTIVGLIIACTGLFGLSFLLTQQRSKELAVRKAIGATSWQMFLIQLKVFFVLTCKGLLVSVPLAYLVLNGWLSSYQQSIELTIWPFLLGSFTLFILTFLTISYHTIQASLKSPVEDLQSA